MPTLDLTESIDPWQVNDAMKGRILGENYIWTELSIIGIVANPI